MEFWPQRALVPLDLRTGSPKDNVLYLEDHHPAMKMPGKRGGCHASCPECENVLDIELDEVEEGDIVACDECGIEYEVVGVNRWSWRGGRHLLDDDDDLLEEEEEEE